MDRWYCIQSHPLAERTALRHLLQQGFDVWLPLLEDGIRSSPLFPCYLFAQLDIDASPWRSILGTFGVKRILDLAGDRPRPLPIGCVEELRRRAEAGEFRAGTPVSPGHDFTPGQRVRVVTGPFQSFDGIVTRTARERVDILLSIFGRSLSTPFRPGQLERIVA